MTNNEFEEKLKELVDERVNSYSGMTLNYYQEKAASTAIYRDTELCQRHEAYKQLYCVMQLAAESGEVAGKYAKHIRTGATVPLDYEAIKKEIGDVLWYIANLANELHFTLEDVAQTNLNKLQDRKERGVLHGEGDNR